MVPSLFVAHGAPLLAIQDNEYTRFLADYGKKLPRPRAIVIFSAHWEAPTQRISHVKSYNTMYDFGGFPAELYQIKYSAPGDAELAEEIQLRLSRSGIAVNLDHHRGLDHGAWVVLHLLYPNADIPVIAMSVNPHLTPREQFAIGQTLAELRATDVLIMGSGGTVHNLGAVNMDATGIEVDTWAREFDDWLAQHLEKWFLEALFQYPNLAPNAQLAVPRFGNEHFVPIFYAMGAADDAKSACLVHRSYQYRNLSQSVWQFG